MRRKIKPSDFFEEILAVPRPSGHEDKIAGYLVNFAQTHNLEYDVDKHSNVIIRKRGTHPFICEPIILQAHTDMVCTSLDSYDFLNKGIEFEIEDGYYHALNSSLGADDGAGMAVILAILANNTLEHPPIEAVFTSSEETTMDGAKYLDYSKIKGHRLISLDGTEEGTIEVSSAGMASITFDYPYKEISNDGTAFQISISGLLGGHSGVDIDKDRGNAIKILANILHDIDDVEICSIDGGTKENVIPCQAKCVLKTNHDLSGEMNFFKTYYQVDYPEIKISLRRVKERDSMSHEDSLRVIELINKLDNEVLKRNDEGMPLTSANIGVISTKNNNVHIDYSIRSCIVGFEDYYVARALKFARKYKFKCDVLDRKPFFTFKEESPVRDLLTMTYKNLYNKEVKLEDVHGGLEGGIFNREIEDLDICVIGCNTYDIHSVNESLEVKSLDRVYEWVVETLKNME